MADEFTNQATALALKDLEDNLIQASRSYEDAQRSDDPLSAADALKSYAQAKRDYEALAGAGQQQQQPGELSRAQLNFLSRRQAGGDLLDPQRMQDYARGHDKAVAAGLRVDSREYFSAIEHYCDHLGDGRQPPLNEREAAKLCGISDEEYSRQAARLQAMKRSGEYGSDR
jgi:hypothetical protein